MESCFKGSLFFAFLRSITLEDLSQEIRGSKHITDLTYKPFVELMVDYRQTGVGGNNSWGARALPRYTLWPRNYMYEFRIRPFSEAEDFQKILRQRFGF